MSKSQGRLVVAPLSIYGSDDSGQITDEERSYLAHRATGIGLYILGAVQVNIEGIGIKGQPRAISEKDIPSIAERAKIVKDKVFSYKSNKSWRIIWK